MGNVVADSFELYKKNLRLVLFFSIPFIIAFAIPLLAPFPTYVSIGAIFLRSASIFVNMNPVSLAVIAISSFFSLLFLSFAFVAISLIVKSDKTHVRIGLRVINDIEKHIGRVFVVLLAYTIFLIVVNILSYYAGLEGFATPLLGFLAFLLIFYAPSAIVVDNKSAWRAIRDSTKLVLREPQYFVIWLLLITVIGSVLDVATIGIFGTFLSRYVMLVLNSVFVLPYFVIFMAEAYMRRFKLLKH
ncbi:MAG: hypothetical protein KGI00_04435 [Candidatus Micrarchaeota archaeon]|nr:hypothetical protein [Candidatus Micrarchaeota archaeon]MDE1849947.1 hypothetical protein [Candidatus Micrarchaeota archaeon]